MNHRFRTAAAPGFGFGLCLLGAFIGSTALAEAPALPAGPSTAPPLTSHKTPIIMSLTQQATGNFNVNLAPEPPSSAAEKAGLGRMSLSKTFHGSLEATSHGEMLAFRSSVPGSAGYVAMETVTGRLDGRAGSFVLQHSSTMTRGTPEQSITVVPDTGTGELAGLAGRMTIIITEGRHSYEFQYTLEAAR